MPARIQLRRVKGWTLPEGAIKVSRPTIYGNPWRVRDTGRPAAFEVYDGHGGSWVYGTKAAAHSGAVTIYDRWLSKNLIPSPYLWTSEKRQELDVQRDQILANLSELRGHDLACWCAPDLDCHSRILLTLANKGHR